MLYSPLVIVGVMTAAFVLGFYFRNLERLLDESSEWIEATSQKDGPADKVDGVNLYAYPLFWDRLHKSKRKVKAINRVLGVLVWACLLWVTYLGLKK